MRLTENVFLLKLDDAGHTVYPVLFRNPATGGLALADAGWPGQFGLIERAILAEGFSLAELDTIILSHQDCDHIACVPDFRKRLPGVAVAAYLLEAPYIDGRRRPCKVVREEARFGLMTPAEKEAFYPYVKSYMDSRTSVDLEIEEGIAFPHAGGIRVIHTPGHTPGHIALLAEGVLFAGDALSVADGVLAGPRPDKSEDMALAAASLKKLSGCGYTQICCYHGGLAEAGDIPLN